MGDHGDLARRLTSALRLTAQPVAMTFINGAARDAEPYGRVFPEPGDDGRTGAVPAGCVFWIDAVERTFATVAADHANCNVGSLTHGFIDLATASQQGDVATLVEVGWVSPDAFPDIPVVEAQPDTIVYGPLADSLATPDVVLIRTDGAGIMTIMAAVPDAVVEGKPQCRIVPLAKEHGVVAASMGCALSRVRTGMDPTELTCAIPGTRLEEIVVAIERAVAADHLVATYAGHDAARFGD